MHDAVLIEAMDNATSLELYQLTALVERLMTDPRRIIEIRRHLHLGQVASFYDARRDRMERARIIDLCDATVVLHGVEVRAEWKLPYSAIEPPIPDSTGTPPAPPPATPAATEPTREEFDHGDKVTFVDRHLQTRFGVITRCNPKRASVACEDGTEWGVPYAMLRRVVEI